MMYDDSTPLYVCATSEARKDSNQKAYPRYIAKLLTNVGVDKRSIRSRSNGDVLYITSLAYPGSENS